MRQEGPKRATRARELRLRQAKSMRSLRYFFSLIGETNHNIKRVRNIKNIVEINQHLIIAWNIPAGIFLWLPYLSMNTSSSMNTGKYEYKFEFEYK
jgi:hypothetical protein